MPRDTPSEGDFRKTDLDEQRCDPSPYMTADLYIATGICITTGQYKLTGWYRAIGCIAESLYALTGASTPADLYVQQQSYIQRQAYTGI